MEKFIKFISLSLLLLCISFVNVAAIETTAETDIDIEETIAVTDIEISDFQNIIKVGETVELTATTLPKNATSPDITYSSADTRIATVNSSGQVKGVSAGKTTLILKAERIEKKIAIEVKTPTKNIELNATHIVMDVKETYQLSANVLPKEAEQKITYRSLSPEILSVTDNGLVTALNKGSASIIVSTWDMSKAVSITVNDTRNVSTNVTEKQPTASNEEKSEIANKILQLPPNGELSVNGSDYPVITTDILKALYGTNKNITFQFEDYDLTVSGDMVKNIDKEFNTKITFSENDNETTFSAEDLFGKVNIKLKKGTEYKYLYFRDSKKSNYKQLNSLNENLFSIDSKGDYLLTSEKINKIKLSPTILIVALALFIIIGVVYILVKKKHWFW